MQSKVDFSQLVREFFPYLFRHHDFAIESELAPPITAAGYVQARLHSPTHVIEFEHDLPFLITWMGLVDGHNLYELSLLIKLIDPHRPNRNVLDDIRKLPGYEALIWQLQDTSQLLAQYLESLLERDLYISKEKELIASSKGLWLRPNRPR